MRKLGGAGRHRRDGDQERGDDPATDTAQSQLISAAEEAGAKPFHVELADAFGEFGAGALHSGGNSCTAGLLTQLSVGGCGVHPSYAGQALLAQSVAKVIKIS